MTNPTIKHSWTQCPKKGCDCPPRFWGSASKFLIEDPHIPAGYVVLHGWICDGLIYGTVVKAGDKHMVSHEHTYLRDLPDRKVSVTDIRGRKC